MIEPKRTGVSTVRQILAVIGVSVTASLTALAQPPKPDAAPSGEAKERARLVAEFAAREAKRYDIRTGEDAPRFELVEQPVLAWSNPVTGEVYGVNYLWTAEGRPAAASSTYRFFNEKTFVNMELVSLVELPVSGRRNGQVVWQAPGPGVEFRPLPDAPAPAATAKARALQTRALARQFTGEQATAKDPEDFANLRLMAKPLHEYEASDGTAGEGAVFAFVSTTDPEILLLIESRKNDAGRAWFYAVARMNFARLRLSHGGRQVWEAPQLAPPWDNLYRPDQPYRVLGWPSPEAADAE
jgi:hypothetical protein